MNELVTEYAQTVMLATRKEAVNIAAEGEKWMKENAPWTDRTEEERELAMRGVISKKTNLWIRRPTLTESNIPARRGLSATVIIDSEEASMQSQLSQLKDAQKNGKKIIQDIRRENARRYKEFKREVGSRYYLDEIQRGLQMLHPTTGRPMVHSATKKPLTQGEYYAALKKRELEAYSGDQPVPDKIDNSAAIKDLEKELRSSKLPFVSIKFQYSEHTPYGIWLEIAHGGKYSIISKTVDRYSQKLFNKVRSIANLKQYRDRLAFGEEMTPQQAFQEFAAAQTAEKKKPYKPWSREVAAERKRRQGQYQRETELYYGESRVELRKRENAIRANSTRQARRIVAKYMSEGGRHAREIKRLEKRYGSVIR